MIGAGSVLIPPTRKSSLLELRRSLRETVGVIDAGVLRELRDELREHYLQIRELVLDPPPPVMLNTDGDPMELHEITYEVESADAAFRALSSLAVGEDEDGLMSDARLDAAGRVEEVEFPWLKRGNAMHEAWDNTILGHVHITGRRMIVEVNSARRARKIQAEIKKRLRGRAVRLETKVRSIEAAMRDQDAAKASSATRRRLREQRELQERPEIQEAIRAMLEAHWRSWPERPIPALGGKTPLEAVKDAEGREMVEALLIEAERRDQGQGSVPVDLTPVRRSLGLAGS